MRYRILRGGFARRFEFERAADSRQVPPAPAQPAPPRAADLGNPYFRCYGSARRIEDIRPKNGQK